MLDSYLILVVGKELGNGFDMAEEDMVFNEQSSSGCVHDLAQER